MCKVIPIRPEPWHPEHHGKFIVLKSPEDIKAAEEVSTHFKINLVISDGLIDTTKISYTIMSVADIAKLINARADQIRTYAKRMQPILTFQEFLKKRQSKKKVLEMV